MQSRSLSEVAHSQINLDSHPRSLANAETLLRGLLLGQSNGSLIGLGDASLLLSNVELNVAVGAEVGGDATVGTVSATTALDSLVNGDVRDNALVDVESLGFSVALGVQEEVADGLGGLFGPAAGVDLEGLALGVSAGVVLDEGDNLLVFEDSFHVLNSLLEEHALDSAGGVVSVLVVSAEIGDLALGGCKVRKQSVAYIWWARRAVWST